MWICNGDGRGRPAASEGGGGTENMSTGIVKPVDLLMVSFQGSVKQFSRVVGLSCALTFWKTNSTSCIGYRRKQFRGCNTGAFLSSSSSGVVDSAKLKSL
jgi:hypothetical protein